MQPEGLMSAYLSSTPHGFPWANNVLSMPRGLSWGQARGSIESRHDPNFPIRDPECANVWLACGSPSSNPARDRPRTRVPRVTLPGFLAGMQATRRWGEEKLETARPDLLISPVIPQSARGQTFHVK